MPVKGNIGRIEELYRDLGGNLGLMWRFIGFRVELPQWRIKLKMEWQLWLHKNPACRDGNNHHHDIGIE